MWIKNGSAATLSTKRSAGVASEVNLRIPLYTADTKHTSKVIYHSFEIQGRISPDVQTWSFSGPTKGLIEFFLNKF